MMLKRFLSYYKPHKKLFAMDMLASLCVAMIGVVYPIVTRRMLNEFIPKREYRMVVGFGLALLGLYAVRMLLNYFIQYEGHMMGVHMQTRMRSDLFAHLEKLPFSFYDHHETGKIMSRMTSDIEGLRNLISSGIVTVYDNALNFFGALFFLAFMSWKLMLAMMIFAPLMAVLAWQFGKHIRPAFADIREQNAVLNTRT